jgi:hypothetical protein
VWVAPQGELPAHHAGVEQPGVLTDVESKRLLVVDLLAPGVQSRQIGGNTRRLLGAARGRPEPQGYEGAP